MRLYVDLSNFSLARLFLITERYIHAVALSSALSIFLFSAIL